MKRITKDKSDKQTNLTSKRQTSHSIVTPDNETKKTTLNLDKFKSKSKTKLKHNLEDVEEVIKKEIDITGEKNIETKSETKVLKEGYITNGIKKETKEEVSLDETKPTVNEIKSGIKKETDEIKEEISLDETKPTVNEIKSEAKQRKATKRSHIDVEYDETKVKIEKQEFDDVDIKPELNDKKEKQEFDDVDIKPELNDENMKFKKDIKFPKNWDILLNNLRQMRRDYNAPVDSMGCDQCMDGNADPKDKRYQALLSLMLSSQTRDQVTHAAMQRLIKHGCNLENVINTSDEKLGKLIHPVGFWKKKVKFIKQSSEMIRDQFGGDIPKTVKDLCKLNGVGPKMAHLCMKTAWGEVTGIGVDTHVHRISNRIGWVKSKNPEETRSQLEGWLPHELWSEVNHLLVGFGQQICLPVEPSCSTCLNCEICPSAKKSKKLKMKCKIKKEFNE